MSWAWLLLVSVQGRVKEDENGVEEDVSRRGITGRVCASDGGCDRIEHRVGFG
jgi:hypothetical protein